MDTAVATPARINNVLASSSARRDRISANSTHLAWPSTRPERLARCASSRYFSCIISINQRAAKSNSRSSTICLTCCSTKAGLDSDNATNKNPALDFDSNLTAQRHATSLPDQPLSSTFSRGMVFGLGPENSWDNAEVGSPVVKRYIGDDEERWYMWYHGRSKGNDTSDSIGLAVSSNGIHWQRGVRSVQSSRDVGLVMDCREDWWAFDTQNIMPSDLVIMSTPMYSSVYWLYYTGFSTEEVMSDFSNFPVVNPERVPHNEKISGSYSPSRTFKSLPGLACSQDGRHWSRIEGDHHSGALFDVGSGKEWDSLFIAAPKVVMHRDDDFRMYYHSFDVENKHFAIGIARSRDGIRWVKLGKILGRESNCSFDEFGAMNAHVVRKSKDGTYLMAYEGVAANGERSIGLAASPDGLKNWVRLQDDAILKPSEEDGWDNKGVGSPYLVQMEGKTNEWRLYYKGMGQNRKTGIGMAVSEGSEIGRFRRWAGIQLEDR